MSIRGGNTNKCVKIHECTVIEKLYPLLLQLYQTFYFDYPSKKSDPFRMGFPCIFLPCFSFVIKAFPAASPPLSGTPDPNFSSILGLRPQGCRAASFSIWKPVTFCPATIPACAPSASPIPAFLTPM